MNSLTSVRITQGGRSIEAKATQGRGWKFQSSDGMFRFGVRNGHDEHGRSIELGL